MEKQREVYSMGERFYSLLLTQKDLDLLLEAIEVYNDSPYPIPGLEELEGKLLRVRYAR